MRDRKSRQLRLSRETIRLLDRFTLEKVRGGDAEVMQDGVQAIITFTCNASCFPCPTYWPLC